jgi:nucleoside-diphosphate-sugar epimerase
MALRYVRAVALRGRRSVPRPQRRLSLRRRNGGAQRKTQSSAPPAHPPKRVKHGETSPTRPAYSGSMAHVLVTGGSGRLGRAVVAELIEHGWRVTVLDVTPTEHSDAGFVRVDLGDHGAVVDAFTGIDDRYESVDAVVHLAAIPAPGLTTNVATFDRNILATHHVFAAARIADITRIVWASSETVLGLPMSPDFPPPYFPVDEEYHPRPTSSYSLAKTLEEELALQYCAWNPALTAIGLRFSNVMEPADYAQFADFDADPARRQWNAWGYIDARDGAQAVRLALTAELTGREIFVIAAADTVMRRSSASLAAEVFPNVVVRGQLTEHETLLSIDKARRLLGYEPAHSWRDETSSAREPEA